jgi:hypothetical protein
MVRYRLKCAVKGNILITHYKAFEELGNKGWNWERLRKYYTKMEQFIQPKVKDDTIRFDLREHGLEGTSCPSCIRPCQLNFSQVL